MSRYSLQVTLLALALAPAPFLAAQTTDPLFRSWEWEEEAQSVRAAGMSGAVVAAAGSDAGSAMHHPAALSLVAETDIRLSLRYTDVRPLGQDQVSSGWTLAQGAVARPVGLRSGVGVYYRSPRALELEIVPDALPDGSSDGGRLRLHVGEAGAAFGTALTPTLRLGVRLGAAHLDMGGASLTTFADGSEARASSNASSWAPSAGLNLLFTPTHRLQAGVTFDSEVRLGARRHGDGGDLAYDLVVPPRLSAGILFRYSTVVVMTGQMDWLGWSRVQDAVVSADGRPPASDYALDDAFEGRFGLELRGEYGESPLWNRAVVRFGLHFRSRGMLEYVGADPVEAARFPGEAGTTEWSLGFGWGPFEVARVRRQHSRDWLIGVRHGF